MIARPTNADEYEQIAAYIHQSDFPRKDRKLEGLRTAALRKIPMRLVYDSILVDGIAIDPSELENGYWL